MGNRQEDTGLAGSLANQQAPGMLTDPAIQHVYRVGMTEGQGTGEAETGEDKSP